ncbi:glycosyltransferase [Rhodopila sp.]|uniref:glycosyltransferase n=1 Tax=Rhodopila sp. TaxID=2480087 RepID=UPI003D12AD0C
MKVLVWQWGRRGAGPRFGACLGEALRGRSGIDVTLSLCADAEIMVGPNPPRCEMPVRTYRGLPSFLLRLATAPLALPFLLWRLRRFMPDLAICAMPGPLDGLMGVALRLLGTRLVVVVHDADAHPGDGFPLQMQLQRLLCRLADGLAVLCAPVGERLRQQRLAGSGPRKLIAFRHPPFGFAMPPVERPVSSRRLLCFGRMLPYKGLDLLAGALATLPADRSIAVRVVGHGPESAALDALRACPNVTVENRWVPETEIGALLAWSDAMILPYREASQSGVAAAALAAGRPVIATEVGGLAEQLAGSHQLLLCEPDAASLSGAIRLWLDAPAPVAPPADAASAWRDAASALLLAIDGALPPKPRRIRGNIRTALGSARFATLRPSSAIATSISDATIPQP